MISEYGGSMPAVVLYGSNVAILGPPRFARWSYTYRHHFLDERVDIGMYR